MIPEEETFEFCLQVIIISFFWLKKKTNLLFCSALIILEPLLSRGSDPCQAVVLASDIIANKLLHEVTKVHERGRHPSLFTHSKLGINLKTNFYSYFVNSILKTIRHYWKTLKKTQINGKIFLAYGLEESVLFKCPYYPEQVTDLVQSLSKFQWNFSKK